MTRPDHRRLERSRSPLRFARRSGVTLVELLLALAILVSMSALAAPTVNRSWERYRVKQAGDQVRAAFSHAHVKAMRTGQTQVVRLELGGDQYAMQPWMAGDEAINASAKEAFEQMQPQQQTTDVKPKHLPEGVIFESSEAKFDLRALEIEEESSKQQSRKVQWSQPILFYPDGTSSQAEVMLKNEQNDAVRVRLRKLTGLTSVSEVSALDTLDDEDEP